MNTMAKNAQRISKHKEMKIRCKIKPNSKKGNLIQKLQDETGEFFEIFVREPAIEGKANLAVIKLLAEEFGVSKLMFNSQFIYLQNTYFKSILIVYKS